MTDSIRVRFAPSPTGSLHLGGVRTALYNYLMARKAQGAFIIRVEDTDLDRNQEGAESHQLEDLKWLGIDWDEGPDGRGEYGPYYQSQRGELYQQYAKQLIDEGKAFACFLTDDEIDALHSHENRQLKSPYRDMSLEDAQQKIDAGEGYVIRYKNTHAKEQYVFQDEVHGKTSLAGDMVGDFVLIRSNGQPVYNFCCAIDDHLMKITHVLRGEEHLSNTLRQMMIYQALGWEYPQFGHLSMILGANRKKLSKRDDSAALQDFISGGYLPEAILNYVALLGWSHSDSEEKFTLSEMIPAFSLDRVNKSPAMFDRDKLNWLNHYHMNQQDAKSILRYLAAVCSSERLSNEEWFTAFWQMIGHQFHTLVEVADCIALFDTYKLQDKELALGEGRAVIEAFKEQVAGYDAITEEVFQSITKSIGSTLEVKGKRLFAPIRVALIGTQSGMELKVLIALLTKQEIVERVTAALST